LAAAAPATLPWKPDRTYKYLWFQEKQKIGATLLRFAKLPGESPPTYQLSLERRLEYEGRSSTTRGELIFRPDGTPIKYREDTDLTTPPNLRGLQNLEVKFTGTKVTTTYINNKRQANASHSEKEVPPETYLFATHALEQWAVFAPRLGGTEESSLNLFDPQLQSVLKVTFTPEKTPQSIVSGGEKVAATMYRFRSESWKYTGSIWIDKEGRLVQYESGTLRMVLGGPGD
jgi:hypothetical protein